MSETTPHSGDAEGPPAGPGQRLLKGVVIGLALLIVLALALLGYGMVKKSTDPGWRLFGDRAPAAAGQLRATVFGDVRLPLPKGCGIARVRPANGRVYVTGGPTPECRLVIVIDAESGRVLGRYLPGTE